MNKKRDCKRCNSSLIEMDPHTICKPCRQPDPQMFYCSEEDCEACNVIKIYKPLDLILRKQELKNIKKKIDLFSNQHSKTDKSVPALIKKKSEKKIKQSSNSASSSLEDKTTEFSSEIFKSILNGLYKEKTESVNQFSLKADASFPNISGKNENDHLEDLEKRLYDRIMSTLMTSISSDSKINSSASELFNNPSSSSSPCSMASSSKATQVRPSPSFSAKNTDEKVVSSNFGGIDINKNENELQNIIVSLFEENFPDAISKIKKSTNENNRLEHIFKVSSRASDILSKETVLSSPSQALRLCEELSIDSEMAHWPSNLKVADLLHTNFGKLVSMKLHPKFRHMHTVLFGKLNPSLPEEVLGQNFILPDISNEQKNEFLFAREQLQRLILMFSIVDYYCVENVASENSKIVNIFEVLLNLLKVSMEKQSNFVGLLVQEIRRDLLHDAECKESEAISKMILGPIHQTQFFGPYVKELAEIVKKYGSSFTVSSKSENANVNLIKLPPKFKKDDSIEKFIENLELFFETNKTLDKDKPSILESLLPNDLNERILSFIKPNKFTDKNFNELVDIFKKIHENSSNYLSERLKFTKLKQSKGQLITNYVEELEYLLPKCMYGTCSREILRDQFVFGLYDINVQEYLLQKCSWSFEECFKYTENLIKEPMTSETYSGQTSKTGIKRKRDELDEMNKKLKSVSFYNNILGQKGLHKNEVISVSNLQEWNDYFGFDITHTYKVYCPWTGQVLRA